MRCAMAKPTRNGRPYTPSTVDPRSVPLSDSALSALIPVAMLKHRDLSRRYENNIFARAFAGAGAAGVFIAADLCGISVEEVLRRVLEAAQPSCAYGDSLTRDEVAEALRVDTKTVDRLVKRGHLACFRVGRQVRIRPTDLDDYCRRSGEGEPARDVAAVHDAIAKRIGLA